MGRKPDPEIAKKRRRAVELENVGQNARQIAEVMGESSIAKVQRWLQIERGFKTPPYRDAVLKRLKMGMPHGQIAEEVGCTRENVRITAKKHRDDLGGEYKKDHDPQRWVDQFVADPQANKHKRFTRYESFGRALAARLNHAVNTNPKEANELIKMAIEQFKLMRRSARNPGRVRLFTCNLVQAKAISAARERILGRAQLALATLQGLGVDYPKCESCNADLARREAMVLKDLGRYRRAFSRLHTSQNIYLKLGHQGHDGHGNGLGSCADTEVTLLYLTKNPRQSIRVADHALDQYVTPADEILYNSLRFNKTLSLLELDDSASHREAEAVAQALYTAVEPEPSIPRIRIGWLAGRTAEVNGKSDLAQSMYRDACEDAEQLQIIEFFGALLSDEERLQADPALLQERIARLQIHRDGKPQNSFPSWLKPIVPALCRILQVSQDNVVFALAALRQESGGNKYLPLDAAMAA